jgi:hypothetical protein
VVGVLGALAGDWARDVAELCGGPLDHAELASGTDGFGALFGGFLTAELLILQVTINR